MKKVLILGSEGQIGSALETHLRARGIQVIGIDLVFGESHDLRTPGILKFILPSVDFVFFLAFDVGGSRYLEKYEHTLPFIENNMRIMVNTFEALKQFNTPFIFASSQMSNMEYSTYGILKAIGERCTAILGGLTAKFWNVYGVEKDMDKAHVITDFIRMVKARKEIQILTSGKEQRQFLHADDCCACLEILMNKYANIPRDKPLHVASFEWHTIREVASFVSAQAGGGAVGCGNYPDIQEGKRNEPDPYILEHWQPKISLPDGIDRVWKAMQVVP